MFILDEFAFLFDKEFENKEIDDYIEEKIYENLLECVENKYYMTKSSDEIDEEIKLHILAFHIKRYTKKELVALLENCNLPLSLEMFKGKNPIAKKSKGMKCLIEQLQQYDYIGSFKNIENDELHYRVYSKRS